MRNLIRRIWYIATGRRQEQDLADEVAFHREMKAQELRERGVGERDVVAATRRALGNDLSARQQSRDVWVPPWLQDISQDIRFGARMLIKDRRFTIAAVVALGLGIGVNNSVFTILNAALFKELPFPEPSRLVDLRLTDPRGSGSVSYADFRDWQAGTTSFEGLGATVMSTMNISDERGAERLRASYLSANTFRLLRTRPIAGREFIAADERPGAPSATIVSYEIWQTRYAGEPIVGHAIRVNGVPSTIVGVMPPRFAFPMLTQIWQPLSSAPGLSEANRDRRNLGVFGRLADGVNLAEARAEMETVAAGIAGQYPDTHKALRFSITTLRDGMNVARQSSLILATLLGAVGFVLLIACANVASLLLARSTHRSREMAIRASLGASRWRIIRQLLIECALIAVLASALGFWLSIFGGRQMAKAFGVYEVGAPGGTVMPYWVDLSTDTFTWMFLGAACLVASLGIGLVPAWHLAGTNVNDTLKEGGRAGSSVRARRMTGGLIVAELALTMILLCGAGLMVRTFADLYFTDLLIDTKGVVAMRVVLPAQKYATRADQQRFFDSLDDRLSAVPAFASAALVSDVPFMPLGFSLSSLAIRGREAAPGTESPQVFAVTAGPRYFETVGLAVTHGRMLAGADGLPGQEGCVVNERFAERFFPGGDALGQRIQFTTPTSTNAPWLTIVGTSQTLPTFVRKQDTEAVAYVPMKADPRPQRAMSLVIRAANAGAGMETLVDAMRQQVAALDSDLPIFAIQTLDDAAAMGRNSSHMIGSWFVTIAIVALVLATVGLYALTAHGVAQRKQEIGVRMALGAQAPQVVWLFVRRTVVHLVLGLALGLAGALAVGGLLPFLGGTNPRDLLTLIVVSTLLVVVALAASVWPARKAARVDPVVALRAE